MLKNLVIIGGFIFLNFAVAPKNLAQSIDVKQKDSALADAGKWFAAWEMVSKDFYKIKSVQPVEFVFFDELNVYSTSEVSVPNGEIVNGPKLFGNKLVWKRTAHDGKIKLPDGKILPVGLMSFAAPLEKRNAFFIMPLLSFWKAAGVESKEFGLENLVTGVFLHEFSHSQQTRNFGKRITEFESRYKFETDLNDDMLQFYFEKDAVYESLFRDEVKLFYDAANETDKSKSKLLTARAIEKMRDRQRRYFTGERKNLVEIDDFFLTMEGFGQLSMYLWLTSPKGGNFAPDIAQKGVRRGGKFWSQEEGLALFLVLSKYSKPSAWAKLLVGDKTVSVLDLIEKEVRRK